MFGGPAEHCDVLWNTDGFVEGRFEQGMERVDLRRRPGAPVRKRQLA